MIYVRRVCASRILGAKAYIIKSPQCDDDGNRVFNRYIYIYIYSHRMCMPATIPFDIHTYRTGDMGVGLVAVLEKVNLAWLRTAQ